tara:strand:+ start:1263 stop:1559 length:297 start_codon:yes stop_codon:yes gene_type:complete
MPHQDKAFIEHPSYKIKPRTSLGYTLGINRDKDIISPKERIKASPFKEKRRTRMAGEKRVDIFSVRPDQAPFTYTKGTNLPKRFTQTLDIPIDREEEN